MSYIIRKSDGTELVTIADGTLDTTTSLSIPGPNYVGYGDKLNENLIYLLENFSANSAPSGTNLEGQLWYDKFNQKLNVYTRTGYKPVNGIVNAGVQPSQPSDGDLWLNTVTNQTSIFDNGQYKLIGPQYTKQMGVSGMIPSIVDDGTTSGLTHNVLRLQFGNLLIGTVSSDISFVPTPPIAGFPRINTGITFNNDIAATINADVTGSLTGPVTGHVTGDVTGNLVGDVTGNLVGNVTGAITGSLVGPVNGDVTSVNGVITNLSSSNVLIAGGQITGLGNIAATSAIFTRSSTTTAVVTNFSTANAQITSGNLSGITNIAATNLSATNINTGNILVTGGSLTGVSNVVATTGNFGNITVSNIVVTSGSLTNLTLVSATGGQFTNLTTSNAQITSGNVTGLTNLGVTNSVLTNISTGNLQATGGNVSNTVGVNVTLTQSSLVNSTATTQAVGTSNTAIATTAFVHTVVPHGVIWMWNSTAASIPAGFQLCDGSNGTPDLRDKFIVGAGSTYSPADTGGAASVTLSTDQIPSHNHSSSTMSASSASTGDHTHTATSVVTDPGHTHTYGASNNWGSGSANAFDARNLNSFTSGRSTTGISVATTNATTGAHSHTITLSGNVAVTGGGQPHENRPPFYALCYIQKMV
jgi:microcystin-dependent protein